MADVRSEMARQGSDINSFRRELGSLRDLVQTLTPIGQDTAVLREQVKDVEQHVARVETKFDKRWDKLEENQNDARRDSRSLRNILVGVGCAAVLSPIGGILVALAVGGPK
jgi:septal ring factor EnvC (AmiA/AmiB activator)